MANSLDIDLQAEPEEPQKPRGALREFLTSWLPAILAVLVIRSVLIEPFQIPSGSMIPTLAIGDFIVVSKVGYGLRVPFTDIEIAPLGEPERGDVIVFIYPPTQSKDPWCPAKRAARVVSFGLLPGPDQDCTTDFIKRIVGLPGDIIEMRGKALVVNGEPVAYAALARVEEPLGNGQLAAASQWHEALPGRTHVVQLLDDASAHSRFGPIAVPAGHYLMLGDNRDLSGDSRVFGFVPRERLIGRAHRILVSADILGDWAPRLARWGRALI